MNKFFKSVIGKCFLYTVLSVCAFGCVSVDHNPHKIKYLIEQQQGFRTEPFYSLSELEYLDNGCVKFLGFAYGVKDTTIVCGSFSVGHYR